MSKALVSVVIPFYKGDQYLEKTIDSVLQQSYNNFELLIVNDGSPNAENSFFAKLCEKDNRIKVLHKNNGGVACARQFGIARAKGEFIAFCDQDDLWLPEKLAKQIPLFNNPRVGLVYCGAIEDHTTEGRKVELPFFNSYRGNIYSAVINKNEIVSCTAVARKLLLIECQAFDADIELMGVDDWLAWLKMSLICEVDFVQEYLAIHVFHGENYSSNEAKMYKAELICLEKIKPLAQVNEKVQEVKYHQVEANIHLRYAEAFIYNSDFSSGSVALLSAASCVKSSRLKCKGLFFKFTPNTVLLFIQSLMRNMYKK